MGMTKLPGFLTQGTLCGAPKDPSARGTWSHTPAWTPQPAAAPVCSQMPPTSAPRRLPCTCAHSQGPQPPSPCHTHTGSVHRCAHTSTWVRLGARSSGGGALCPLPPSTVAEARGVPWSRPHWPPLSCGDALSPSGHGSFHGCSSAENVVLLTACAYVHVCAQSMHTLQILGPLREHHLALQLACIW